MFSASNAAMQIPADETTMPAAEAATGVGRPLPAQSDLLQNLHGALRADDRGARGRARHAVRERYETDPCRAAVPGEDRREAGADARFSEPRGVGCFRAVNLGGRERRVFSLVLAPVVAPACGCRLLVCSLQFHRSGADRILSEPVLP